TDDVTIGISSSQPSEGTVSTPSLTFTTADWNTPQTVTVTGVDDAISDGPFAYTVVTDPAASNDPTFDTLHASDGDVLNIDHATPGSAVTPTSGLTTTEAGGVAKFSVVLATQPTDDVTIGVSSSDTTEGTVSVSSLTFTPANWDTVQTVTVTGVNDNLDD